MLQKFKEYQNQILVAFKRFPVVIGFAIYSALSFTALHLLEDSHFFEDIYSRVLIWLSLYPIPAMFLSYTLTLREEVLQKRNPKIHLLAQAAWLFVFYIILQIYPQYLTESMGFYSALSISLIASPFVVPFIRMPSDLSLWRFLGKNIKAAVLGILTTALLNAAVAFLFFAISTIFDVSIPEKAWIISAIFCWAAIFPILFLSSIPEITNDSSLHRKKFATNVIHFLFIPIYFLYVGFLYAYGLKIIFLHANYEMVSVFASIAIASTLIITAVIYPSHYDSEQKMDRKFLVAMPLLALPLAIAQAIDIAHQMQSTYTSLELVYMADLTIWFFVAIAISIFCKKKKLRWLIVSFCIAFFLSSVGPQSAINISRNSWIREFVNLLNQKGYSELPLDCSDYTKLHKSLLQSDDDSYGTFEILRSRISSSFGERELAKYIPANVYDCFNDEPEEIDSTAVDFHAFYLVKKPYPVPKNRSKAIYWDGHIDENLFDIRNDSLLINFKLDKEDSLSTYHYAIPLDTLKIRSENDSSGNPVILENGSSTFVVQDFNLYRNGNSKSLMLKGIVYLK